MSDLSTLFADTVAALERPGLSLDRRLQLRASLFALLRLNESLLTTAVAHLVLWLDASDHWPPHELATWPVNGLPTRTPSIRAT